MKPSSSNIAIVVSLFNSKVTLALLESAKKTLQEAGVASERIRVVKVPGAFELPVACAKLAKDPDVTCLIAIGCVIRGDTPHFEYISSEVTRGLMSVSITTVKPVIMGVLTTNTEEQAIDRCHLGARVVNSCSFKPQARDKGIEFAEAALTMIEVFQGENTF